MRWLDEVLEMDPLSKIIELKHHKVEAQGGGLSESTEGPSL